MARAVATWCYRSYSVVARTTAHPVGRILPGVGRDLVRGRREEVDVELVRQADEVDEDIRQLVAGLGQGCPVEGVGLFLRAPLEDLQQLSGLPGEGHGEVRGGVEPVPVALGGKLT